MEIVFVQLYELLSDSTVGGGAGRNIADRVDMPNRTNIQSSASPSPCFLFLLHTYGTYERSLSVLQAVRELITQV